MKRGVGIIGNHVTDIDGDVQAKATTKESEEKDSTMDDERNITGEVIVQANGAAKVLHRLSGSASYVVASLRCSSRSVIRPLTIR